MPLPRHLCCALLAALTLLTACRRPPLLNYPDGFREFAYVANRDGNSVTVLDLVFFRVDRTLAIPTPVAVVTNPLRTEVYALSQAGSIAVINTDDNRIRATIPVGRELTALAVDPSGRRAFVLSSGAHTVSAIDLDTDRVLLTLPAGQHPTGLALAPDGRSLVVADSAGGTVLVYATPVLPVATAPGLPIPGPAPQPHNEPPLRLRATFPGCPGATSPVVPPHTAKAFIACPAASQVLVLSLAEPADPAASRQATSDNILTLLDVGHNPTVMTAKPDGGEVFVSNTGSDSISEIATSTNEVESTSQIGSRPAHALIDRDSTVLWVANSGADSISLYSIDDGARLPFVRTGVAPDALAFSADEALLLAADTGSGDVAVIRTAAKPTPGLLTILPAGRDPVSIAIKAMPAKP